MRKILIIITAVFMITAFTACSARSSQHTQAPVTTSTSAAMKPETSPDANENLTLGPTRSTEMPVTPSSDDSTENPYNNPLSLTFWQYYIFELYRGAVKDAFTETVEYSASAAWGGYPRMTFDIKYPQIDGVVILCVDYKDIKDILKTEVVTY